MSSEYPASDELDIPGGYESAIFEYSAAGFNQSPRLAR